MIFSKNAILGFFLAAVSGASSLATDTVITASIYVKSEITATVQQSVQFGDIKMPLTNAACDMLITGLNNGHCQDTNNAQLGLIDLTGTPNSSVQITGTNGSESGLAYHARFGAGADPLISVYNAVLGNDGKLTVSVGGSLQLQPAQMAYDQNSVMSSTVTVTYN